MSDLNTVQALADSFLNPPAGSPDSEDMQKFANLSQIAATACGCDFFVDGTTAKDRMSVIREALLTRVDALFDFLNRAKISGLEIPSNPFDIVKQKNIVDGKIRTRFSQIKIASLEATETVSSLKKIVNLYRDEKSGKLVLKKNQIGDLAQISSYAISAEGLGNYSVGDLAGFVPNADSYKLTQTIAALSSLDFTKRVPRMLFTCEYSPDGFSFNGAIVGWKRMLDASGYIIKRHDVFRNVDREFILENEEILDKQRILSDYVNTFILSFYEISPDKVMSWLDESVEQDSYYTYSLTAYQTSPLLAGSIFNVKKVQSILPQGKLKEIETEIQRTLDNQRVSTSRSVFTSMSRSIDDVSPYPSISQNLYGDSKNDWILAGLNTKNSVDRKDNIEKVRSYSYLGSTISFLSTEILSGRFFVPEDLTDIVKNVEKSIANFGVTRTLIEILDSTGLLFFFGEKDVNSDALDPGISTETGMLASILSAIDPETATIDPKKLSTNMLSTSKTLTRTTGRLQSSLTRDIKINLNTDSSTNETFSDEASQFVGNLSDDGSLIDLTTYQGISRLMRTVKTYFDFNNSRGT